MGFEQSSKIAKNVSDWEGKWVLKDLVKINFELNVSINPITNIFLVMGFYSPYIKEVAVSISITTASSLVCKSSPSRK